MRGQRSKSPGTRDKETSGLKQYVIYCVLNFFGLSPSKFILELPIVTVKLKNNVWRTKILEKNQAKFKQIYFKIIKFIKKKKEAALKDPTGLPSLEQNISKTFHNAA